MDVFSTLIVAGSAGLDSIKSKINSRVARSARLQAKLSNLTKEASGYSAQLQELRKNLEQLNEQLLARQTELEAGHAAIDRMQTQLAFLSEAQLQLKVVTSSIERLKQSSEILENDLLFFGPDDNLSDEMKQNREALEKLFVAAANIIDEQDNS